MSSYRRAASCLTPSPIVMCCRQRRWATSFKCKGAVCVSDWGRRRVTAWWRSLFIASQRALLQMPMLTSYCNNSVSRRFKGFKIDACRRAHPCIVSGSWGKMDIQNRKHECSKALNIMAAEKCCRGSRQSRSPELLWFSCDTVFFCPRVKIIFSEWLLQIAMISDAWFHPSSALSLTTLQFRQSFGALCSSKGEQTCVCLPSSILPLFCQTSVILKHYMSGKQPSADVFLSTPGLDNKTLRVGFVYTYACIKYCLQIFGAGRHVCSRACYRLQPPHVK